MACLALRDTRKGACVVKQSLRGASKNASLIQASNVITVCCRALLLAPEGAPVARGVCFSNDRSYKTLCRHPQARLSAGILSALLWACPVAGSFARKPERNDAVAPADHGLRNLFLRSALLVIRWKH